MTDFELEINNATRYYINGKELNLEEYLKEIKEKDDDRYSKET